MVEIMIVRPKRTVRDMTSKVTALGQTKYLQAHVAFLELCILKRHRQM